MKIFLILVTNFADYKTTGFCNLKGVRSVIELVKLVLGNLRSQIVVRPYEFKEVLSILVIFRRKGRLLQPSVFI